MKTENLPRCVSTQLKGRRESAIDVITKIMADGEHRNIDDIIIAAWKQHSKRVSRATAYNKLSLLKTSKALAGDGFGTYWRA